MKLIRIHARDNVAVALETIAKGERMLLDNIEIISRQVIERGHKIALCDIPCGTYVIKYGNPIAVASKDIKKGDWVHTHNAKTTLSGKEDYVYEPRSYVLPEYSKKEAAEKIFLGYRRKDGSVGVRNELWILPIVGCVNGVARQLFSMNQHLVEGSLEGLYCFPHPFGCSQLGDDLAMTKTVLAGLARHPNAGGVLCLGLGCENLELSMFREALGDFDENRIRFLLCQEAEDELEEGSRILEELAAYAKNFKREPIPASELIVGLKCGGSDGLSGITANPTVGCFSDRLISLGATTILTEVPEMFGAENLLFSRCENQAVFDQAVRMTNDFKNYYLDHGQVVYENPSPGNRKGGITTLEDKSCGCVQKGGSAKIVDVLGYAQPVVKKGLNLLSGPGNDLVSTTNLTSAGAQIILFTTGRGTPFGAPAPTVKISTNTNLYLRKKNWIDFNAGTVADGEETLEDAGKRLLDFVLQVASGQKTCSEIHDCREIAVFKDGVVL